MIGSASSVAASDVATIELSHPVIDYTSLVFVAYVGGVYAPVELPAEYVRQLCINSGKRVRTQHFINDTYKGYLEIDGRRSSGNTLSITNGMSTALSNIYVYGIK